jgi:hypothetical protein
MEVTLLFLELVALLVVKPDVVVDAKKIPVTPTIRSNGVKRLTNQDSVEA